MGRSTVREATKALVSRNILEVHRGNGTFVCEQTGLVQDPLGLRFSRTKSGWASIQRVRLMIEPEIAALAAQKATEEEIARMRALCDAIEEKVRRNENYGALDQPAYALAACTRNAIMPNLVPILSQAIPLFIDITKRALQMQSLCTHQAVVDAIRARDSEAARQAMRVHLEDNRRSIEALPDDDS
ncbi:MAG: FadR/GntR family transcriptional regulator [Ruthenibacterium lactatiformans]